MRNAEFQPFIPELYPELPVRHVAQDSCTEDAMEDLADSITSKMDLPIDVRRLAKYFGIMRIDELHLSHKTKGTLGDLSSTSNHPYYQVEIDSRMQEQEKRTTIAHEIGHAVIHRMNVESSSFADREDYANRFARAILLPRTSLKIDGYEDIFEMFSVLLEQTQMEPGYLAKRLVEDLKLVEDTLIVVLAENNKLTWTGYVATNNCIFPKYDEKDSDNHVARRFFMHVIDRFGLEYPYVGRTYPVENGRITHNKKGKSTMYIFEGGSEIFGRETVGGGREMTFALCRLHIGEKVAEAIDPSYLNLSGTLEIYH